MSETLSKVATRAIPGILVAAVLVGCTSEKSAPQENQNHPTSTSNSEGYHNPAIAGPKLAQRIASCTLKVVDVPNAYSKTHSTQKLAQRDPIKFEIDAKLNPSIKPYYEAFANDGGVIWKDAGYVTRAHAAAAKETRYLPAPSMRGGAEASMTSKGHITTSAAAADGVRTTGMLYPGSAYDAGSIIDVWTDETSHYEKGDKEMTTFNARFCGQIALRNVAGKFEWQLNAHQKSPMEPLATGTVPYNDPGYGREMNPMQSN